MTNRFARYRRQVGSLPISNRSHMVYTEAQTLDEALEIIKYRNRKNLRKRIKKGGYVKSLDEAFGYTKPVKVTLPKLKFMELDDPNAKDDND